MTLFDFIDKHPLLTFAFVLIFSDMVVEVAKALGK